MNRTDSPLKFVHLEDSPNDALLIAAVVGDAFPEAEIRQVDDAQGFLEAIQAPDLQLVLSDYSLPSYDGLSALAALRTVQPELPFIFVSGAMGEDMAVECMKIGATDYVLKSNLKRLPSAIRRALSELDARLALTDAARVAKVVPWRHDGSTDTWLFGTLVQDLLGHAPDTLSRTPGLLAACLHPEDRSRFAAAFAQARAGARVDFDCRVQHAAGHWIWTRWILAGSSDHCRGVLQDITELHSTQEALIQSQRLEALATMIGAITHDFGNLVASMNGAAECLALSPLAEPQRRHVDTLIRNGERAMAFTRELMRLARKEEAPERQRVDLNALIHEAVALLHHALPRGIALTFEGAPDLPLAWGIPSQLHQVLMNLGINARDAMGDQGRLMIRTATKVDPATGARQILLEVSDTGPGIPPESRARIFEAFFTTKATGTGLGLATVQAIVRQHDGHLDVDCPPGQGTCFRILLPSA